MRKIDIELEGVTATAQLLDDQAPNTCQRLWDKLPFEDRFTHSKWSGLLVHSNKHPDLDLDVSRYPLIENPTDFLAPGDVIVWPQNGEIGIAYGSAEFRWQTGAWVVTKVAAIEGDLAEFAKKADLMLWEGAKKLTIRPKGSEEERRDQFFEGGKKTGKKVEIEFDGLKWVAELYEDETPEYCQALWDSLPLEGPVTITHSSGEILHFWVQISVPPNAPKSIQKILPVEYQRRQVGVTSVSYDPHSMRGQHPGDIIWGSTWNGIRLVYGQGRFGGQGTPAARPKLGRIIQGDLEAFAERARRIEWEGSKPMIIRRLSET